MYPMLPLLPVPVFQILTFEPCAQSDISSLACVYTAAPAAAMQANPEVAVVMAKVTAAATEESRKAAAAAVVELVRSAGVIVFAVSTRLSLASGSCTDQHRHEYTVSKQHQIRFMFTTSLVHSDTKVVIAHTGTHVPAHRMWRVSDTRFPFKTFSQTLPLTPPQWYHL